MILIAAMWAMAAGIVAGSAHAQSQPPPQERFVLTGVMFVEGEEGLAWLQEPVFTHNEAITVRVGDRVGPYRLTKILEDQVELQGPGGPVSIPLAGSPSTVRVAGGRGTLQPEARELPTPPALSYQKAAVIPLGDADTKFPASDLLVGAGARLIDEAARQQRQMEASKPRAERPPRPAPDNSQAVSIPLGDADTKFPASKLLLGAGARLDGGPVGRPW